MEKRKAARERRTSGFFKERDESHAKLAELLKKAAMPEPPGVLELAKHRAGGLRRELEVELEELEEAEANIWRRIRAVKKAKKAAVEFEAAYFRK